MIEACLASVQLAQEIIVVDSFSTDNTPQLAQKFTDKVWQRAYQGPAEQKNWAIPQASHDWVLLLDADERVSPELWQAIGQIVAQNPDVDAYHIPRKSQFMGRWIKYSGWQNDSVIRLIRRDKCRYNAVQVHEEIDTTGLRVGRLVPKLEHYTYKNLSHFLEKQRRYAEWSARDKIATTGRIGLFHLLLKPTFRFFSHYVLKLGILDGRQGFIISAIMGWSVFLRYLYMLELRQKKA